MRLEFRGGHAFKNDDLDSHVSLGILVEDKEHRKSKYFYSDKFISRVKDLYQGVSRDFNEKKLDQLRKRLAVNGEASRRVEIIDIQDDKIRCENAIRPLTETNNIREAKLVSLLIATFHLDKFHDDDIEDMLFDIWNHSEEKTLFHSDLRRYLCNTFYLDYCEAALNVFGVAKKPKPKSKKPNRWPIAYVEWLKGNIKGKSKDAINEFGLQRRGLVSFYDKYVYAQRKGYINESKEALSRALTKLDPLHEDYDSDKSYLEEKIAKIS